MKIEHPTFGKDEILTLLQYCSTQIEKWQIANNLDSQFARIPDNGKPYVFSNQFDFLMQMRIELENNAHLFINREDKFREIEKWCVSKMEKGVYVDVAPLKFNPAVLEQNPGNTAQQHKLTQPEQALIFIYDKVETKDIDKLIKERQWDKKKFYSIYNPFNISRNSRTGTEPRGKNDSDTKSQNKLKTIRGIIGYLKTPAGKKAAKEEADILELNIQAEKK